MTPAQFRIIEALCDHGPLTGQQIAEKARIAYHTFKNCYRNELIAAGMIHQSGWHFYGHGHVAVFSAGIGPTPPRPVRHVDHGARCREWKVRTGYSEAQKAARRLRRPPDRALAALLGLPAFKHQEGRR